jgi:phosphoribosylformimino-5-aminoimidazole carboxamide ribotide isomerase
MNGSMTLIPVIDLLKGQVVRGVRGDRQAYRPIESALCASSDPGTVAGMLVDHCAAQQLYVADLDALMGGRPQRDVLHDLLTALPGIELWLDAGFADAAAASDLGSQLAPHAGRIVPVFGSESLRSRTALEDCRKRFGAAGAVLSLDRREWPAPRCCRLLGCRIALAAARHRDDARARGLGCRAGSGNHG